MGDDELTAIVAKAMAEGDWRDDELAVDHPDGWYDMDAYVEHAKVQHVYRRRAEAFMAALRLNGLSITGKE